MLCENLLEVELGDGHDNILSILALHCIDMFGI